MRVSSSVVSSALRSNTPRNISVVTHSTVLDALSKRELGVCVLEQCEGSMIFVSSLVLLTFRSCFRLKFLPTTSIWAQNYFSSYWWICLRTGNTVSPTTPNNFVINFAWFLWIHGSVTTKSPVSQSYCRTKQLKSVSIERERHHHNNSRRSYLQYDGLVQESGNETSKFLWEFIFCFFPQSTISAFLKQSFLAGALTDYQNESCWACRMLCWHLEYVVFDYAAPVYSQK